MLKPDIYGFLKNFIEPWYESGKLSETDRIILSGQSSKTGLFKDVLKEYVAGRKANPPAGSSCAGKLMSIDGAVLYRQDKNTGRIRASLEYEPARVPYSLAADDYNAGGREKILLEKGSLAGQVYGWISRPVEAAEVLFRLKDGTGKEVSSIPFLLHKKNYKEIKDRDEAAESYAKDLRNKYKDVIVTKEYIHDDVLVRATTIKERYRDENIRDRQKKE